jgi:hypothetical protein
VTVVPSLRLVVVVLVDRTHPDTLISTGEYGRSLAQLAEALRAQSQRNEHTVCVSVQSLLYERVA